MQRGYGVLHSDFSCWRVLKQLVHRMYTYPGSTVSKNEKREEDERSPMETRPLCVSHKTFKCKKNKTRAIVFRVSSPFNFPLLKKLSCHSFFTARVFIHYFQQMIIQGVWKVTSGFVV